ncbi:MAG: hypothetical protein PHR04_02415 [Syntrophomonadaceae bacterium]|nr:hypothetical protein [Syntrophomonadaceae bacterium]MDD4562235.1 hypothetical protein [Syntrophomonadaceae bacterium]
MDFRRCLIIALLVGVITYALRRSSMVAGGHTILLITIIIILVSLINKSNILHNMASIMLGSMIMGAIEGVWCPLFLSLTSHSLEDLAIYPWINIACFMPILVVALIIYILIRKHSFVVYNLNPKGI